MPMQVLEHVSGREIPAKWREEKGLNLDETFKLLIVPDKEIQEPPKRKVYSDEVKAIAKEAKRLSEEDKKAGVTREESFKRMEETMKKIGTHLKNTNQ